MYAAGELVVYGGEGVCRVEGVGAPSLPGMDKTRLYYTLSPLYRYHQVLTSYDCRRLAGLIKGVCRRRSWAVHHGRKISQMDERYLKRAEDALYGELGAVLGLPREEVPAYIRKTWPKWPLF